MPALLRDAAPALRARGGAACTRRILKFLPAPPQNFKAMAAARAAISAKCAGVIEYFVSRYLAEQTARSVASLAEQSAVLGSGAVIQYVSRSVVTTAMVIGPVVFYDRREGRCVASLSYRTMSLDDESFGYAQTIKKVLVPAPAPRLHPTLEMWLPAGDLAQSSKKARDRRSAS